MSELAAATRGPNFCVAFIFVIFVVVVVVSLFVVVFFCFFFFACHKPRRNVHELDRPFVSCKVGVSRQTGCRARDTKPRAQRSYTRIYMLIVLLLLLLCMYRYGYIFLLLYVYILSLSLDQQKHIKPPARFIYTSQCVLFG